MYALQNILQTSNCALDEMDEQSLSMCKYRVYYFIAWRVVCVCKLLIAITLSQQTLERLSANICMQIFFGAFAQ